MRYILTISLVLALAACGQKGPLYLPKADQPEKPKSQLFNELK